MTRGAIVRAVLMTLTVAAGLYTAILATCYLLDVPGVDRHNVESGGFWFAGLSVLVLLNGAPSGPVASLPAAETTARWRAAVGALAVAALLTAALFLPALFLGFFSDDFVLIHRSLNGSILAAGNWEYFRPFPLAVWTAVLGFAGVTALPLHVLNLVQHAGNGALVFVLARRLGLQSRTGAGAAALFMVFPAAVEPVVWPSGTFDLWLVTAGLAGAVIVLGEWPTAIRAAAATACVVVGLFSKEAAVVLPVLWSLAAWAGRRQTRATAAVLGLPFALVLAFAIWRLQWGVPAQYAESVTRYMAKELSSRLFGTLFLPWSAEAHRAHPGLVIGYTLSAVVLTLTVLALSTVVGRIRRVLTAMLLWIVVSVLPLYSFFIVSPDLQGSRYVYLAVAGWSIALALALEGASWRLDRRNRVAVLSVGVLVATGAMGIRLHLTDWQEAARVRDQILQSADREISRSGCACDASSFDGVTDSVGGAYVFRNGFRQALTLRRSDCTREPVDYLPRCAFEWKDGTFVRPGVQ